MREFNILFTSVGRRVSLINHFKFTLKELGLNGKIITADISNTASAAFISDSHEIVPRVSDRNYVEQILGLCKKHNITLLIPLIDSELTLLSKHKEEFDAINVVVLVSSTKTNDICFDKRNTYEYFKEINVDTPKILNSEHILADKNSEFPYFIKPASGSSSIGATKIINERELKFFKEYVPDAILQENIEGQEFTIDVLVDFKGQVRCVVPRLRLETRAGEVSKGITVKNDEIMKKARLVASHLPGALGCITIQCFLTNEGLIKFIEINPRFGGGVPLSIKAGADYPKWIIQLLLEDEVFISDDLWQDGIVMLRYDEAVFVTKDMIT